MYCCRFSGSLGQSVLTYNHGQKSWDTFCISWVFSNSHMSSPNPTNNVFFSNPSFNFIEGGERENCKKNFEKDALLIFMREPRNYQKL